MNKNIRYSGWLIMLLAIIFAAMFPFPATADTKNEEMGFEKIFDDNQVVMFIIRPESGDIIKANRGAKEFYGYDIQTLESMNVSQINTMPGGKIAREMEKATKGKRNYFLFQHRLYNGDIRTVEVYSYPVEYKGESVLFTIVHDITEKTMLKQANLRLMAITIAVSLCVLIVLIVSVVRLRKRSAELNKVNKRLDNTDRVRDAFINANNSFVYLKDENLNYIFANKALLKYYNRTEEEILGKDVYTILDEEFAQNSTETDRDVLKQQEVIINTVKRHGRFYKTLKFPVLMQNGTYGVGAFIDDITEEYQMKTGIERLHRQNKLLYEVLSKNFNSIQEQLDYALNGILEISESEFGYIYIYNEAKGEFILSAWSLGVMPACKVGGAPMHYKLVDAGLWAEAVRQGRPIIVNDLDAPNPLKKGYPEGHIKLKRLMSIPVLVGGKIVAVAGVVNKDADYSEDDVNEFSTIMSGVWTGVQRRQSMESLQHMSFHDNLTGLYNRRFFEEELRRMDNQRNWPLSILIGDIDDLKLVNDIFGHNKGDQLIMAVGKAIADVCRADDIVARWGGDEFVVLLPKTDEDEARAIVSRIKEKVSEGEICGIKNSISIASGTKTEEQENMEDKISNAETKMYESKALKRDKLHGEEMDAIARLLFSNNEKEKGHALRVSALCKRLGVVLGLPESEINRLEKAGKLHDIGMVAIDKEVLRKSGHELSPSEKFMLEQHTATGGRLLNYFDKTFDIGEAILAHHENWDGSGFPKGLVREEIPLIARIIHIAAFYDNIINVGNNGPIKTEDEAIEEIRKQSGIMFDPYLVNIFINMLKE